MEQIDDYIEPLIEIQRIAKELGKKTLHKDFESAYKLANEMESEVSKLKNWCGNNINEKTD